MQPIFLPSSGLENLHQRFSQKWPRPTGALRCLAKAKPSQEAQAFLLFPMFQSFPDQCAPGTLGLQLGDRCAGPGPSVTWLAQNSWSPLGLSPSALAASDTSQCGKGWEAPRWMLEAGERKDWLEQRAASGGGDGEEGVGLRGSRTPRT